MISYVLSDETNKSFSIEHTLMATAMRSLVERCLSYVNKIKDDDINPEHEKLAIISDHAICSSGIGDLLTKAKFHEDIIKKMTSEMEKLKMVIKDLTKELDDLQDEINNDCLAYPTWGPIVQGPMIDRLEEMSQRLKAMNADRT